MLLFRMAIREGGKDAHEHFQSPSCICHKFINCGNALIAPSKSEYDDSGHMRHMWTCPKCDTCFNSLEQVPVEEMTSDDVVGWVGV